MVSLRFFVDILFLTDLITSIKSAGSAKSARKKTKKLLRVFDSLIPSNNKNLFLRYYESYHKSL